MLALLGHGTDLLRLPMVPVSAVTRRKLEMLIGELGLLASVASNDENLRMF